MQGAHVQLALSREFAVLGGDTIASGCPAHFAASVKWVFCIYEQGKLLKLHEKIGSV